MSRSKKDILDTESMLTRLSECLLAHRDLGVNTETGLPSLVARDDAEALRRISMTLHTWHELECGTDRGHIARGRWEGEKFVSDENGKPFIVQQFGGSAGTWRHEHKDLERGALKRLKAIMARYPALSYYVQGDPRGCALYILKPGDVPAGESVDAYYSRGLAVYR